MPLLTYEDNEPTPVLVSRNWGTGWRCCRSPLVGRDNGCEAGDDGLPETGRLMRGSA